MNHNPYFQLPHLRSGQHALSTHRGHSLGAETFSHTHTPTPRPFAPEALRVHAVCRREKKAAAVPCFVWVMCLNLKCAVAATVSVTYARAAYAAEKGRLRQAHRHVS